MAYFSKYVSNFLKTALSSISPNKVVGYTQIQYETEYAGCEVIHEKDSMFFFYKVANHFDMVYVPRGVTVENGEEVPFAFSLFRFQGDETAGVAAFVRHIEVLGPLHEARVSLQLPCDRLVIEKITTLCRDQCGWSAAHVAASLSWQEVFKCPALECMLNRYDSLSGMTPLRIAIEAKDLNMIEFLLSLPSISLAGVDHKGYTVLHLAATHGSSKMLSVILSHLGDEVDVNAVNDDGDTALHLACVKPSLECVELLLNAGANPLVGAGDLPLHQAVVADSIECVDLIYRYCPQTIDCQQPSTLDYPIHLASNPKMFHRLCELGANLDAQNSSGLTVLHMKVRENDLDGVLHLLTHGADTNLGDSDGATPLHYAIMFNASIHIIRALLIFEADPCAVDNLSRSPRHLLCADPTEYIHSDERDLALYTLHAVGALRCPPTLEDCTVGCMDSDCMRVNCLIPFDGTAPEVVHNLNDETDSLFDEIFFTRREPPTGVVEEEESDVTSNTKNFQNRRSSRYSRSLRRSSRHDLARASTSPTARLAETISTTSSSVDTSSPEAKRMAGDRTNWHMYRRMSYQASSNPTSPQRSSAATGRFSLMTSDEETSSPNDSNREPLPRIGSPPNLAGDKPQRISRVQDFNETSSVSFFVPHDCCCDEAFLKELHGTLPDSKHPQQTDPDSSDAKMDLTYLNTPDPLTEVQRRSSQSTIRKHTWSLSSSSASLSTDEYGLSKDCCHSHTDTEQLPDSSTSFNEMNTVRQSDVESPTPLHQTGQLFEPNSMMAESGWSCGPHGYRVLALDGGGVRGLILVQLLRALEKASGRRVTDLFDWFIGTSTGGILALLLVRGKCLRCCRNLLFGFKDQVFCGRRPYPAEGLETQLRRQLGEKTVMTDLKGIRVAVTTLLSDRCPPLLHMFRNYTSPRIQLQNLLKESQKRCSGNGYSFYRNSISDRARYTNLRCTGTGEVQRARAPSLTSSSSVLNFLMSASGFLNAGDAANTADNESDQNFEPLTPDSEQLVWKAARATGAAPTYFRPCGRFLDGGLISNNPTLDLLTELQELHMVQQLKRKPVTPLAVVVSLGTGRMPVEPIETVDVFRPQSIRETFRSAMGFSSLGRIIIEVATMSEGPVVDRASAWCASLGVPFFRFSPRLSLWASLDTVDAKELLQIIWEAEAYIYRAHDRIQQLASML